MAYNTWVRGTREDLAACSDTYGDKPTVLAKIEKLHSLSPTLSEGKDKLGTIHDLSDQVLGKTADDGHSRIKNEVEVMDRDYKDLEGRVKAAGEDLESCLSRWETYDLSREEFEAWLAAMEEMLRQTPYLQPSLLDKQHQLDHYQVRIKVLK